jgi:hypothetical protein
LGLLLPSFKKPLHAMPDDRKSWGFIFHRKTRARRRGVSRIIVPMNKTNTRSTPDKTDGSSAAKKRLAEEQAVIALMIRLYCKGRKHERGGALVCPACQELADYAAERLRYCPVAENRSFCQFCSVHCYRAAMRTRISEVMRYSGPKMLWYKPLYALHHLRELRKHRRQKPTS